MVNCLRLDPRMCSSGLSTGVHKQLRWVTSFELCDHPGTFSPSGSPFWVFDQKAGTLFTYLCHVLPRNALTSGAKGQKDKERENRVSPPPRWTTAPLDREASSSSEFYMTACPHFPPPQVTARGPLSYSSNLNKRISPGIPSVYIEVHLGAQKAVNPDQ